MSVKTYGFQEIENIITIKNIIKHPPMKNKFLFEMSYNTNNM